MTSSSDSVEIRPLRPAEAEAWRALRLQMLKESPTAFSSAYEDAVELDLERFASRIPDDGVDALFGLFVHGRLAGSAGFAVERGRKVRHKGGLWGVYVAPEVRGRGLGAALLARLIEHARQHVAVLQGGVVTANAGAWALYRRLGFEQYGLEADALRIDGRAYDEALLRLRLDPPC